MTEFHTSDLHFFHRNIITFCDRPYRTPDGHPDIGAMHAALIENWNARVSDKDRVYVHGDVAYRFPKPRHVRELLGQLRGEKVLIKGNHDHRLTDTQWRSMGFAAVYPGDPASGGGLVLHDALLTHQEPTELKWLALKAAHNLKYCLHGHVHEKWSRQGDFINVGVDVRSFRPVTYKELVT